MCASTRWPRVASDLAAAQPTAGSAARSSDLERAKSPLDRVAGYDTQRVLCGREGVGLDVDPGSDQVRPGRNTESERQRRCSDRNCAEARTLVGLQQLAACHADARQGHGKREGPEVVVAPAHGDPSHECRRVMDRRRAWLADHWAGQTFETKRRATAAGAVGDCSSRPRAPSVADRPRGDAAEEVDSLADLVVGQAVLAESSHPCPSRLRRPVRTVPLPGIAEVR